VGSNGRSEGTKECSIEMQSIVDRATEAASVRS